MFTTTTDYLQHSPRCLSFCQGIETQGKCAQPWDRKTCFARYHTNATVSQVAAWHSLQEAACSSWAALWPSLLHRVDDRVINEWWWTGNDLVRSGHGLILRYYPSILSATGWSLIQSNPIVCLIVCVITETPKGALCSSLKCKRNKNPSIHLDRLRKTKKTSIRIAISWGRDLKQGPPGYKLKYHDVRYWRWRQYVSLKHWYQPKVRPVS
jgi:hypothetical protein